MIRCCPVVHSNGCAYKLYVGCPLINCGDILGDKYWSIDDELEIGEVKRKEEARGICDGDGKTVGNARNEVRGKGREVNKRGIQRSCVCVGLNG